MPYLTWVISKFLNLGFSLEQVIAMATVSPVKTIGKMPKLETLQVGARRTCTLPEAVEGPVEFVDLRNNKRQARCRSAGAALGRPYQAPFATLGLKAGS